MEEEGAAAGESELRALRVLQTVSNKKLGGWSPSRAHSLVVVQDDATLGQRIDGRCFYLLVVPVEPESVPSQAARHRGRGQFDCSSTVKSSGAQDFQAGRVQLWRFLAHSSTKQKMM